MDLRELERMRVRKIFKLFSLLILNTAALIVTIAKINDSNIASIVILVYIIFYCMIASIPKNFENETKKNLLPYLLKNIIKEDGEIKWQGSEFEIEEKNPEKDIIDKLEDTIDKRCTTSKSNPKNLDKYIDYTIEQSKLEEKEALTPSETERLKEIKAFIEQEDKAARAALEEKHNIRLQLLKQIETNNSLNQYSNEDLVKIDYLKKENQFYNEQTELTNLLEKDEEELTPDEISRMNYLQQKSDEHYSKLDKDILKTLSDTDRGLCLFNAFNTSITYDDVFYGNYKGNEFVAIEGKENKIFTGTVIRLPLKTQFHNTLLILCKKACGITSSGTEGLKKDLHSINLDTFNKHTVWAESSNEISNIVNNKFVDYVNNSNNNFSYLFKNNYAYLIWPHQKDYFKLGGLFKKIDDKRQYEKFVKDLHLMLLELEKFANSINDNLQ